MARRSRKSKKDLPADPLTDAEVDDAPTAEQEPDAADPNEKGEDEEDDGRDEQLCKKEELKTTLTDLYAEVEQGFNDQADRSDDILDYWDLYNCKIGQHQAYSGNSKIFVPIIPNAVRARKTRFVNQIFPQSGRNVECTTSEDKPNDLVALLEHYIRRSKLRTRVMPPLMVNGDVEGQYSVYVSWGSSTRKVTQRVIKPLKLVDEPIPGTEDDDIEEAEITRAAPKVEVLADADVLILPATADSVDDALEVGGSVTVIRRWSKSQINKMAADGEFDEDAAKELIGMMGKEDGAMRTDKQKKMIDAAGIKNDNGREYALGYETWTMLTYKGENAMYKIYFGGEKIFLGCKRNPYWSDRCPVLSVPVDKVQGSAKGISKLKTCADMQYAANDAVNEGMDSAAYSMLPIIMTDPLKNPRVGTMVLNLAAIWETNPNDTQFAQFPELWKSAFAVVGSCEQKINQTLSVTPAMMPQSTSTDQRRNQAELAQEAQVDILSTADAVTVLEEGILTPMLQWFVELDHQFRDKAITVKQFGEMGVRVNMEEIKPIQMDKRFEFRWYGVESARNAQQVQQQIAAINVVRGVPPEQYEGYKLNLRPWISNLLENTFGARMAPELFVSMRSQLSQDPQAENQLLEGGFDIPVHPLDEDAQHLQAHQQLLQGGDPTGVVRVHMAKHIQQLTQKTQQQAMMQQQQQQLAQGMPGIPGGAGPGGAQPAPGVAGTPRIGAQPQMPTGGQGPPGMIHQDRMNGAGIAPRR
jgi:hypothetical protein